jgi:hypothetical protein
MLVGLLGLGVLAPLGYVLMYGRLGVPMLGARGSGLAAAITCLTAAGAEAGAMARSPARMAAAPGTVGAGIGTPLGALTPGTSVSAVEAGIEGVSTVSPE